MVQSDQKVFASDVTVDESVSALELGSHRSEARTGVSKYEANGYRLDGVTRLGRYGTSSTFTPREICGEMKRGHRWPKSELRHRHSLSNRRDTIQEALDVAWP